METTIKTVEESILETNKKNVINQRGYNWDLVDVADFMLTVADHETVLKALAESGWVLDDILNEWVITSKVTDEYALELARNHRTRFITDKWRLA